ncbi:MAG: T9SS type A sorting domain-containing protein [Gemmatimonadales bacterium]|nr:T9SS type A sorting domain-containing protein [Gemmatimonadales bacterium]
MNNCWITGDGYHWDPLEASYQMAIVPEMSVEKSGNVLVLAKPDGRIFGSEKQVEPIAPLQLNLSAVPNPFNPSTEICFSLPQAGFVQLSVFDMRGRLIRNLLQEFRPAGPVSITWNGKDRTGCTTASGAYFVRMKSGNLYLSTRVTLVK